MNDTNDYALCDQQHPGSDQEARDWHDRYHRNPDPIATHRPNLRRCATCGAPCSPPTLGPRPACSRCF